MTGEPARRILFVVVALVATATACGDSAPDAVGSESMVLAERIFAAAGSSGEAAALRREQDMALAEATAACMNESGFDYVAYVAPEVTAAHYPAADGSRYPDPDFVERYGYGITLSILDPANGIAPRDSLEQSSPNGAIFMRLPENEQDEYIGAEETCRGAAIASVPALRQTGKIFEVLAEDLAGIPDRVLSDQRMIDYLDSWKTCMSQAGWEVDSPDHTDRHIEQVLDTALASAGSHQETISQLERVIVIEADVASSDLECGGGPAATAQYEALELEYQAQVVAENLAEVKDILRTP